MRYIFKSELFLDRNYSFQGGEDAFVIDDSGPGDLEDESELDPSKYMENMSGDIDDEMEEVVMEEEEEEEEVE